MPVGSYPVPPKRQTDRFGQSQILASPKNSTPNATLKKWNFQLNLDNTRTITPKPKAFSARRHTPSKVAARVGGGGSISARGTRGTQNMVKAVKRRPKVGKLSLDKIVKTSQPHWPSSLPSSSRSGPNSFRSGGVKNARKGRFKMKNGTFVEPMSARCFSEAHRKESNGPLSARGRLSSSKKKGKISPDLKQAWATSHSSSSDGVPIVTYESRLFCSLVCGACGIYSCFSLKITLLDLRSSRCWHLLPRKKGSTGKRGGKSLMTKRREEF